MTGLSHSGTASVSLQGVYKSFGAVDVLQDINLEISQGEFVVFVGPSGCGKSTLLRVIAGLEEASDGAIAIGGRDVTDTDPSQRGIAMVFQSYALYPHLTVAENMGFSLKMAGKPKGEVAEKVNRAASILHLDQLLDRRPGQLSGGQRQRVAIGRAIVRDPQVFLFDEPLSNLDAELRIEMRIEIAKLHRSLGNTMIYVTHDQTEAMTLADRIVVLRGGKIEQVGAPAEIYSNPDNLFVAGFIGAPKMNFIHGAIKGESVTAGETILPIPQILKGLEDGAEVIVGLRPEHIRIAPPDSAKLLLRVDFIEYLGDRTYCYGHLPDGQAIVVGSHTGMRAGPRSMLGLDYDPVHLLLFGSGGERIRAF